MSGHLTAFADAAQSAARTDCDFRVKPTLARIAEDLSVPWREYYKVTSRAGNNAQTAFGFNPVWGGLLPGPLWGRLDPEVEADPSPESAAAQLAACGIDRAVLNPGIAPRLAGLSDPRWAAELARATNHWLARDWLEQDERFLTSIVLAPRSPGMMVKEIERAARTPRVVQAVLAFPHLYLGDRRMYPVYEALVEHRLTLLVQAGGAYTGSSRGFTSVGGPTFPYEVDALQLGAALPHLTSLIAHGVFERFPQLRVCFGGYGVAWLISLVWQLDMSFTNNRLVRPPHLTRLPSSTIREHVRFTTERLESSPERIRRGLSLIDGESLVVFGSGARGLEQLPMELSDVEPESWTASILCENQACLTGRTID